MLTRLTRHPLSAEQYKAAIARHGMSSPQASLLLGGKPGYGRRWPREGAPYAVALVLAIMDACDLGPEDIAELGAAWRQGDGMEQKTAFEIIAATRKAIAESKAALEQAEQQLAKLPPTLQPGKLSGNYKPMGSYFSE